MSILKDCFVLMFFISVIGYLFLKCKYYKSELHKQKDFFINMLGHDIRVPILAQIRALDIIKKTFNLSEDELLLTEEINNSCKYSLDIISMLSYIYKIENGAIKLYLEQLNLSEIINSIINEYSTYLSEKNIKLNCRNESLLLNADKKYFTKALKILLLTTIQYSDNDTNIHVNFDMSKNKLRIIINYHGNSLTNEEYKRMFDLNPKYSAIGNGIKMYLCKKLIDIHGGNISVDIKNQEQNSFIITVPLKSHAQV